MNQKSLITAFVTQSWKLWLLGLATGLIVGLVVTSRLQSKFDGSVSFSVTKPQTTSQATAQFYLYDGYYSQQAAQAIKIALEDWLTSPGTVIDIYKGAGLAVNSTSINDLTRTFKISETKSSILNIKFSTETEISAKTLGDSIVTRTKTDFKTDGVITAHAPLVVKVSPNKGLVFAGITLALVALSAGISLILHYFRND